MRQLKRHYTASMQGPAQPSLMCQSRYVLESVFVRTLFDILNHGTGSKQQGPATINSSPPLEIHVKHDVDEEGCGLLLSSFASSYVKHSIKHGVSLPA